MRHAGLKEADVGDRSCSILGTYACEQTYRGNELVIQKAGGPFDWKLSCTEVDVWRFESEVNPKFGSGLLRPKK